MGLMGQGVSKMECHDETKPALVSHYRSLDPCNCFNPGIGRTSKSMRWQGPKSDAGRDLQVM
jgi:hypothetical protein